MSLPLHLYSLPLDVWERIGYHVVASEQTFLGPPTGLRTLSLVSRPLRDILSVRANSSIYARIFRFKFDYAAPRRRLTERWLTTKCLAKELVKRFSVMRRIRRREHIDEEGLWTVYLMLLEGDGKNESQLTQWAGLREYLAIISVVRARLWGQEPTVDALLTWLLWMTGSRPLLQGEHPELRNIICTVLHPFIVTGYRHPAYHGPDTYFKLPLCSDHDVIKPHCSGPAPPVSSITHYSHQLTLAVPIVTTAALLATTVRTEALQDADSFPRSAQGLPPDRPTANSQGILGPTLEDVIEFHYTNRIDVRSTSMPDIVVDFEEDEDVSENDDEDPTQSRSEGFDEEWSRLVSCHSIWGSGNALRGTVFRLGSLCGSWAGRVVHATFPDQMRLLYEPGFAPASAPLHHQPLYWNLQEHHCLDPDEPIDGGTDETDGDDLLNAWLPRGVVIHKLADAIEVTDPNAGRTVRYETFIPRSVAPYSKNACEKLQSRWISDTETDKDIAEHTTGPEVGAAYADPISPSEPSIDDDEEYADDVSYLTSGVTDIIVTGETGELHGDAWGHYTIIGRVRSWDGLVVLLRTPRDPTQSHLGRWIFRGYLHGSNLVGRWRGTSTLVDLVDFEGGFVLRKTDGD